MKFRLSISQLLVLVLSIAIGLAALANPTALWEGIVFAVSLILLFTAIVGVVYRTGGDRAFWLGFSIFGWGLFLLGSDLSIGFRSSGGQVAVGAPRNYAGNSQEADPPFRVLVKGLIDSLPFDRTLRPKAVGEKIEVQWGNLSTYYPSSVLEIKPDQYKIRYDNDLQGT